MKIKLSRKQLSKILQSKFLIYLFIFSQIRKLSVMGWDEFLRQIAVPIILNRSNYDLKKSQARRASLPNQLPKTTVISHMNLTTNNITPTVIITRGFSADDSFRKHGKILQKLNRQYQKEELRRKQLGAVVDWSIVEDIKEDNFEVPKLKPNARDERQTISAPWLVVKDMQQLRNQPILITTTRYHMLKA
jgi:hypothetical protein